MNICVLEWITGGGLSSTSQLDSGLLEEGFAMLSTLVDGACRANCQVTLTLDERCDSSKWNDDPQVKLVAVPQHNSQVNWLQKWGELASRADLAILVAPEIDGTLADVVQFLREHLQETGTATRLLNTHGVSLQLACDKWATHKFFQRFNLPTPDTGLLQHFSATQHSECASPENKEVNGQQSWVVKPRNGAGMEQTALVSTAELRTFAKSDLDANAFIIQPWIDSNAYSCSAIVNANGDWHWLPTVTQEITTESIADSSCQGLHYSGSTLAFEPEFPRAWKETLESQLSDAQGWISFDFIQCLSTGELYLIEINPRCTTSISSLAAAYRGNLVAELLGLAPCGDYGDRRCWRST